MHDIERIRSTLNLVTLAEQAGAKLRKSGPSWHGACPLHGGDNPNGFHIFPGRDGRLHWTCFTKDCNERGKGTDEFAFLMAHSGKTLKEVLEDLDGGKPLEISPVDATERRLRELERQVKEQQERIQKLENWQRSEPWKRYHETAPEMAREAWRKAGVPDSWQSFWKCGGTTSFTYTASNEQRYTSPTLTIPIWEKSNPDKAWNCLTVRHRLLSPIDPRDKYRPDVPGLGSHPFLADPDLGYDIADRTIIVEGEKKAQVVFLTLDNLTQVIGMPGKKYWRPVAEKLQGRDGVYICLDPDANGEAEEMAVAIGGARVIKFNRKLDDTIVQYGLKDTWLEGLMQTGKLVK